MTAKLVLDTRYQRKDERFPICIRIRSGKQMKHIATGHYIPEKAWNKTEVKKNFRDADIINADIHKQLSAMTTKLRLATSDHISDLNIIVAAKDAQPTGMLFSDYILHRATQYDQEKKIKHAYKVRRLLLDMQHCLNIKDIPFELTADDMRAFNAFLMDLPNTTNTIRHKFEKLQQLFDNAVKEKKTMADNPFISFRMPKKAVHKAKLTLEEIAAIEALPLPGGVISDSRNIFLFSYYCKGMRFEDCLRFKRQYIINDRAVFEQIRKGHKTISVKIHSRLRSLLDLYINNKTPYLFPFLKKELLIDKTHVLTEANERERIAKVEAQNTIVNRNLKVVIELAGIQKNISMHNSRHTFAQHLKENKKSLSVISQALGHSSERVTKFYLDSLDDEAIDDDVNELYE